jgi:hypothetical protein
MRVVEHRNDALAAGRGALWLPTIRGAVIASGLDVYCPVCRTSRAIDVERSTAHPLAVALCSGCDARDYRTVHVPAGSEGEREDLIPPKPQPPPPTNWDVYLARHTPAKWISTVEAADAGAAIAEAAVCIHGEFRRITGHGVDTRETARNEPTFCLSTRMCSTVHFSHATLICSKVAHVIDGSP